MYNPAFYLLDKNTQSTLKTDLLDNETKAKRIHYNRNLLNTNLPNTADLANKDGWSRLSFWRSIFHQHEAPIWSANLKFISSDGHKEAVYNSDGKMVNSVEDAWTYNFFDPTHNSIPHTRYDVLPYDLWWNSKDDSVWLFGRVTWI